MGADAPPRSHAIHRRPPACASAVPSQCAGEAHSVLFCFVFIVGNHFVGGAVIPTWSHSLHCRSPASTSATPFQRASVALFQLFDMWKSCLFLYGCAHCSVPCVPPRCSRLVAPECALLRISLLSDACSLILQNLMLNTLCIGTKVWVASILMPFPSFPTHYFLAPTLLPLNQALHAVCSAPSPSLSLLPLICQPMEVFLLPCMHNAIASQACVRQRTSGRLQRAARATNRSHAPPFSLYTLQLPVPCDQTMIASPVSPHKLAVHLCSCPSKSRGASLEPHVQATFLCTATQPSGQRNCPCCPACWQPGPPC